MSLRRIKSLLVELYGSEKGDTAYEKIGRLINDFPKKSEKYQDYFFHEDVVLISYGDSIRSHGSTTPLETLHSFCNRYLDDAISTVHLLPFFPYSSDDGFSVKDFYAVDPALGGWEDITSFGNDFKMMFDFVLNHISAQSNWFGCYLEESDDFRELAIEVDPATDLSMVTRPRSLPLLTAFEKASGEKVHLWTTFSADQVDINYSSVTILIKMIEVMLFYVKMGATILRLDAIAYLWKEIGTSCIHLESTHKVVKLFRAILDEIAPEVMIITETNVPHAENISYFGNGNDEAQMVYNFTLPPLLLHAFLKEDTGLLTEWVSSLTLPSPTNTFFNFTASHDGVGVRPLEGILEKQEIDDIIALVTQNGGMVSTKRNSDGSDSPYELNISYVDAYLQGEQGQDPLHAKRFLASQAIQMTLPGVPAFYIHSLLGTHNWTEGVKQTERARTINRQKLNLEELEKDLSNPDSFRSQVFYPFRELIRIRRRQPAFHPKSGFNVLNLGASLFALERHTSEQALVCITNITDKIQTTQLASECLPETVIDLISNETVNTRSIALNPYRSLWLTDKPY